jgi:hypothetical protein
MGDSECVDIASNLTSKRGLGDRSEYAFAIESVKSRAPTLGHKVVRVEGLRSPFTDRLKSTHFAQTNFPIADVQRMELQQFFVLCGYTAHRLLHRRVRSFERLRVRQIRTARSIRRLWRVLHNQFDDSPRALSSPVSRHRDTEVDTRRDAG